MVNFRCILYLLRIREGHTKGFLMTNYLKQSASAAILAVCAMAAATPASAAEIITPINADLRNGDFTFTFLDSTFTFGSSGNIFNPLTIQTSPNAAVSSFGGFLGIPVNPSPFFTNRGTVQFGPDAFGAYASFSEETAVPASNGENFLGLRATFEGQDYFGYAFTTNSVLNTIGFQNAPNTTITATTATGAIPEPATWALFILGFGVIGAAMRSAARKNVSVKFA
ncbi:PEP-CTERM sorting domain-containing protein [Erythrobacter litoralis]|nr:PEP-CTERM sorting domain-containing protein [Erythrobacter litoralis]